jgi:hypothetical protein
MSEAKPCRRPAGAFVAAECHAGRSEALALGTRPTADVGLMSSADSPKASDLCRWRTLSRTGRLSIPKLKVELLKILTTEFQFKMSLLE